MSERLLALALTVMVVGFATQAAMVITGLQRLETAPELPPSVSAPAPATEPAYAHSGVTEESAPEIHDASDYIN